MAETLTITSEDNTTLSSFLESPPRVSAKEAAKTSVRIALAAAASGGTIAKNTIQLAKKALLALSNHALTEAVPHLLPLCERETPLHVIDAFVLSTCAVKSVTDMLIKSGKNDLAMAISTALHVTQCLCRNALKSLLRTVTILHNRAGNVLDDATKCIRLVKFYCAYARRCSDFTAKTLRTTTMKDINIDRSTLDVQGIANVITPVFRLVSVLTYILSTKKKDIEGSISSVIETAITQSMSVALKSMMGCLSTLFTSGVSAIAVMAKSLELVGDQKAFLEHGQAGNSVNGMPGLDAHLLRLFTVLHLMRLCASCQPTDDSYGWLHDLFQPLLCRNLFHSLDGSYNSVVTLRNPTTGMPLLHSVCAASAEALSATHRHVNINALLVEMSARNPARATVASETLKKIYATNGRFRKHILVNVLACARGACALRSGHFESRWLPLSTGITELWEKIFQQQVSEETNGRVETEFETDLLTALHLSRERASPRAPALPVGVRGEHPRGMSFSLNDAFAVRIIAALCERLVDDDGSKVRLKRVLKNVKLDRDMARDRVEKHIAYLTKRSPENMPSSSNNTPSRNSTWVEAMVHLVPFLYDVHSHAAAVVSKLVCNAEGMVTTSTPSFCAVLNHVDVANTEAATLQQLGRAALSLVGQEGGPACVAVVAFAGRVMTHYKQGDGGNEIGVGVGGVQAEWANRLMQAGVEAVIQNRRRNQVGVSMRNEAVHGGAVWQAAKTCHPLMSAATAGAGPTAGGLNGEARRLVEEAAARGAECAEASTGVQREGEWIGQEKATCVRGPVGKRTGAVGALGAARERVVHALRVGRGRGRSEEHVAQEDERATEIEALRDAVGVMQ